MRSGFSPKGEKNRLPLMRELSSAGETEGGKALFSKGGGGHRPPGDSCESPLSKGGVTRSVTGDSCSPPTFLLQVYNVHLSH